MTVMAGFEMSEAYFVPRTEIGLPHGTTIERCMELIFGTRYHKWKDEQASAEGDHSECGTRFFTRLLPYLVEVLVQDGIYLINDFPTHPMSVHLRVSTGAVFRQSCRNLRNTSIANFSCTCPTYGMNCAAKEQTWRRVRELGTGKEDGGGAQA